MAKTAKMIGFNGDCDKAPTLKAARLDIGAKLLPLGLESVDVPAEAIASYTQRGLRSYSLTTGTLIWCQR